MILHARREASPADDGQVSHNRRRTGIRNHTPNAMELGNNPPSFNANTRSTTLH
jgi:hypothetical protein